MWKSRSLGRRLQVLWLLLSPFRPIHKKLQPLPQTPLPQTFQEPKFKELDDPEGYCNFADVLQVLNSIEIDENIGQNKECEGQFKRKFRILRFSGCLIFYIKCNQFGYRLSFWDATCILFKDQLLCL